MIEHRLKILESSRYNCLLQQSSLNTNYEHLFGLYLVYSSAPSIQNAQVWHLRNVQIRSDRPNPARLHADQEGEKKQKECICISL